MIDLHCHVLPGIDDGPANVEDAAGMLRAAAEAGIETIVATPHVSARYPNDPDTIAAAARLLSEPLAQTGVELKLGAEVAATRIAELDPETLDELHLGEGPWLLLEPPFASVAVGLGTTVAELHRRGHRVMIAHPERCAAFQRDRGLLESLVAQGALTSLTAGSLTGRFGSEARRFAMALLDAEMAHNVTSDAHDRTGRPPSIAAELDAAGLSELADWLTLEVPVAILAGENPPPRPRFASRRVASPARRRRSWLRFGR